MKMLRTFWVVLMFASVSAFAMGHGPELQLENFTKGTRTVWAKVVSEVPAGSYLMVHELGANERIAIGSKMWEGSEPLIWKPGVVLAYLESFEKPIGTTHFLRKEGQLWKAIIEISPQEYQALRNNVQNYIDPLSLSEFSYAAQEGFQFESMPQVPDDVLEIDEAQLLKHVRVLAGVDSFTNDGKTTTIPERGSTNSRNLTQQYLLSVYKALGVDAQLRCYSTLFRSGCNVEGTLWGSDRSNVVVVSSHLDSVNNAGADDNASGTATVLEAARLLRSKALKTSVRFVSFDQEELGLVGSAAYVKEFGNKQPKIVANINMDMIAYDSDNDSGFHIIDCSRSDSVSFSKLAMEINQANGYGLKRVEGCSDRSDHGSFWQRNIPAIVFSENFFGGDENRCYHRSCDKMDLFNVPFFVKLANLVVNTTYAVAK